MNSSYFHAIHIQICLNLTLLDPCTLTDKLYAFAYEYVYTERGMNITHKKKKKNPISQKITAFKVIIKYFFFPFKESDTGIVSLSLLDKLERKVGQRWVRL